MQAQVIQINKPTLKWKAEMGLTTLFLKKHVEDLKTPVEFKKLFRKELERRKAKR